MSATAAPWGLMAAAHASGEVRQTVLVDGILSGYTSALYQGSPVMMGTDGTIKAVTAANDPIYGIFAGCEYTRTDQMRRVLPWFPANQTYIAGSMLAQIVPIGPDPGALLIGQSNGVVNLVNRGESINIAAGPTVSNFTGLSSQALGAPTGATAGSFTIYDI